MIDTAIDTIQRKTFKIQVFLLALYHSCSSNWVSEFPMLSSMEKVDVALEKNDMHDGFVFGSNLFFSSEFSILSDVSHKLFAYMSQAIHGDAKSKNKPWFRVNGTLWQSHNTLAGMT